MTSSIFTSEGFLPVELPPSLERGLDMPHVRRDEKFLASFERRVLFYDVFWNHDGSRVILHGPAPTGLEHHYKALRIVARPSGQELRVEGHHSPLVQLFSAMAPPDTTQLDILIGTEWVKAKVGPNYCETFRDQNVLFTLSKDNDLAWIVDWARFHVVHHAVSAVVLFDNNSSRYSRAELEQALSSVPGLQVAAVVPTPFRYTREDAAHPQNLFWAHFLQPSVMVNLLQRYGLAARGIMNCDIDELLVPLTAISAFDTARRSRSGSVYFRDCWIEPVPEAPATAPYRHADFQMVAAGTDYSKGPTAKWVIDPSRRWLRDLRRHPYPHAIENRPFATRHKPGTAYVAHFKAISTGWKYDRSVQQMDGKGMREEPMLRAAMQCAFGDPIPGASE